jgi:tRNA-uridine 2-sulfurtransferase
VKKRKIGIALSGGVDSTACALLLLPHHEVHGFFMRLTGPDPTLLAAQEQRARAVAARLKIGLEVIDLSFAFTRTILHSFTATYARGRTPNPCMLCNQTIKFGLFQGAILARGMDAMATGHYARIESDGDFLHLCKGRDTAKDQSYFLARLNQQRLRHCLFPLGEMTKEASYQIVEEQGLTGFRGQESQDICFLGTTPVARFLQEHLGQAAPPGSIVTADGRVLGSHQGLFHYTIGQRRGLGLADITPWYVVALDPHTNHVIIGKEDELYHNRLIIQSPHWLQDGPEAGQDYQVKIRYRHQGASARVQQIDGTLWEICFDAPQRAITPGQYAVIYAQDRVIGCGEIQ